jgi:hypothetical protein
MIPLLRRRLRPKVGGINLHKVLLSIGIEATGLLVAQRRGDFELQLVNKCETLVIIDSHIQRT